MLAWSTCLDFVVHSENYTEKGSLSRIMAFVSSMGMSQADLPSELRNRMNPEASKPASKAKAKPAPKRRGKASAPAVTPAAGESEEEAPVSKKRKTEKAEKSRKRKAAKST